MAVKRVEWKCPICGRRYAVRADIPRPERCPRCRNVPAAEPASPPELPIPDLTEPTATPTEPSQAQPSQASTPQPPPLPPVHTAPTVEPVTPQLPEGEFPELGEADLETVSPPMEEAPVVARRKYPALRLISVSYRIMAALVAVGGLLALFWALQSAVADPPSAERTAGILFNLGVFAGSVVAAVSLAAFGELIQVLLDIEENTRRH